MLMSISDEQLALNQGLHKSDPSFGSRVQAAGIAAYLPLALFRMHGNGMCSSVLDYGTGKGMLVDRLRAQLPDTIDIDGFDPAVPKWSNKPNSPADIVLCLDVLEHVERKSIDDVMSDIQRLTRLFCLVVVDLRPAVKTLPDGRNAHILLEPSDWWVSRFSKYFKCQTSFELPHECGEIQKVVIAATQDPKLLPFVYSFLNKINVYGLCFKGGNF